MTGSPGPGKSTLYWCIGMIVKSTLYLCIRMIVNDQQSWSWKVNFVCVSLGCL